MGNWFRIFRSELAAGDDGGAGEVGRVRQLQPAVHGVDRGVSDTAAQHRSVGVLDERPHRQRHLAVHLAARECIASVT